jgi:Ca-activated chloride channel family protein
MKPNVTLSVVLAALFCAPVVSADVEQGIRLLRQAREALEQNDPNAALTLLDLAYVELPFSAEEDLVYHGRADAFAADGRLQEALAEYGKALHKPNAHRARFNSGVLQHRLAEQALEAAGVPLDPAGIPAEADPAPLIEAIEQNLPLLEQARMQLMQALRLSADAAGRESVTALTHRIDDLNEMLEELRRRQQEQEQNEDEENEDEQNEDENEQDEEGDEQENQDEGDQEQDQPSEDEQDQDEQQQPPPDEAEPQQQPQPRPELTPAQLADLLEKLEELEQKAMEMDRLRRAQAQAGAEKDW